MSIFKPVKGERRYYALLLIGLISIGWAVALLFWNLFYAPFWTKVFSDAIISIFPILICISIGLGSLKYCRQMITKEVLSRKVE
jgi:hypothetical protein